MKNIAICIYTLLFVFLTQITAFANTLIERETLFKIPFAISEIIGMRVSGDNIFIADSRGRFVKFDLISRKIFKGKVSADKIVDFAIVAGDLVFINGEGIVRDQKRRYRWSAQKFSACRIDADGRSLFLTGGSRAIYLDENTKDPFYINNLVLAYPMSKGLIWTMGIRKTGEWGLDIADSFGNKMKEIFTYSSTFNPSGIELGSLGIEGEVLVSAYEDGNRKLSLIGHNGRMFWKIDGPEKLTPRDISFDRTGNILAIEMVDGDICVNRWKLSMPQG